MSKSLSLFWSIWFRASTARGQRDLNRKEGICYYWLLQLISLQSSKTPQPSQQHDGTYLRSMEKASDNFWRSVTGTDLRQRSSTFPTRSIPRKANSSLSSSITRVPIRCLQRNYTFDVASVHLVGPLCECRTRNQSYVVV